MVSKTAFKHIFLILGICISFLSSCSEEANLMEGNGLHSGKPIELSVDINDYPSTRGVVEESKRTFQVGELLHIRAVYDCSRTGGNEIKVDYGIFKYDGQGKWSPWDSEYGLYWPDEAVSASFKAYYIYGSNGPLTSNTMEAKLLADYEYGEDPLCGEVKDLKYGSSVKLEMRHIFSHLTLTEMAIDVPDELWFEAIPNSNEEEFHNAFYLDFDPDTKIMSPKYISIPSDLYKDKDDRSLTFVEGSIEQYDAENGEVMTRVSYFLEPRVYHKFLLRYPRSRTECSTYFSYNRDLVFTTGEEGFVENGRYEFSVLKSLGVVVEDTPDDSWDDKNPVYIIDVEDFLKAAASGQDYWEDVEGSDEKIQILEKTATGTRLLENISFHYQYYRIFEDGYLPNLSNTFDGNYHYIYNLAAPLFNENHGNIINLGLRDIKTEIIESNENFEFSGSTYDISYNGLISCINYGTVKNMRIINAEMDVRVRTSDPYEPTQEAHSMALLFGENRGSVYNIILGGNLALTVDNADGETIMPNVLIGSLAGQNLGLISGVSSIEDENIPSPVITLTNKCKGDNGVYLMGGVSGNNTGTLDDIFMASVTINASESSGVESRLGGIVGEMPNSNAGSPEINACIVRGNVRAGKVNSLTNVTSLTYTGGVAGSINIQGVVYNTSVSVGVTGSSYTDGGVIYATGGAFGRIEVTEGVSEGKIEKLAAFGPDLWGVSTYAGNFAGISAKGYGWNHYEDNEINVSQKLANNVGIEL